MAVSQNRMSQLVQNTEKEKLLSKFKEFRLARDKEVEQMQLQLHAIGLKKKWQLQILELAEKRSKSFDIFERLSVWFGVTSQDLDRLNDRERLIWAEMIYIRVKGWNWIISARAWKYRKFYLELRGRPKLLARVLKRDYWMFRGRVSYGVVDSEYNINGLKYREKAVL